MKLTKARITDVIWHSVKALLCSLQLLALHAVTMTSIGNLMNFLYVDLVVRKGSTADILLSFMHPLMVVILFAVWWHYYDTIDDRSFRRFRDTYKEESEAPNLLRDPAYLAGLAVTVACATPVITFALVPALRNTGLENTLCYAAGVSASLLLTAGISLLRIRRRSKLWYKQRNLPEDTEKTRLGSRIFYAVLLLVSVLLAIPLGFTILIPFLGSLILGIIRLLWKPILFIGGILFLWLFVIRSIRRIADRRRFLKRLDQLQERGELSYEIHGSPYLSVFWERIVFGITITDLPHQSNKRKTPVTYQVAFANCRYRRGMVILCEDNVFRFVISFNFRTIAQHNWGGLSVASSSIVSMPLASFCTNHSFDFPEGEGKRILLVDPAPRMLCMYGFREGELITLDNGSEIFGYTVYGKNSFVNLLERT